MACTACKTIPECAARAECLRSELLHAVITDVRTYLDTASRRSFLGYRIPLQELRAAIARDLLAELQFCSGHTGGQTGPRSDDTP